MLTKSLLEAAVSTFRRAAGIKSTDDEDNYDPVDDRGTMKWVWAARPMAKSPVSPASDGDGAAEKVFGYAGGRRSAVVQAEDWVETLSQGSDDGEPEDDRPQPGMRVNSGIHRQPLVLRNHGVVSFSSMKQAPTSVYRIEPSSRNKSSPALLSFGKAPRSSQVAPMDLPGTTCFDADFGTVNGAANSNTPVEGARPEAKEEVKKGQERPALRFKCRQPGRTKSSSMTALGPSTARPAQ